MTLFRVDLDASEHAFMSPPDETILHSALRQGIGFPYECSTGACGSCRFELISGDVQTLWAEAPGLSERMRARGNRHLACQTVARSDLRIKAHPEERCCPPIAPTLSTAVLTERRSLTHDMTEFVFRTDQPAEFMPGQYVLLRTARVSGARAYSMCNLPNDRGEWRLIIKRKAEGVLTGSLFDTATVGQTVELSGPYGMAYLSREMAGDILCIAGGSGLSPVLSVAMAAIRSDRERKVELFYGGRTPKDIIELSAIAESDCLPVGSVMFIPAISEAVDGWPGERGFIHEVAARRATISQDTNVFVAGPRPMITETLRILAETGVRRDKIHFDSFY